MTVRTSFFSIPTMLLFAVVFAAPAGGGESCLTSGCHPQLDTLQFRHVPVSDGDCEVCHRPLPAPHPGGGSPAFELTYAGSDLCKQCHEVPGSGAIVHAPIQIGDCLACHAPHGGNRFLLRTDGRTADLCLNCHDDPAAGHPVVHGPVAAGDCLACHDPHRAPEKKLLKNPVRDLCLACHTDFAALDKAPYTHPPVREDECTACHLPHGSPAPYLLATGLPDLCVSCHDDIGRKMDESPSRHAPLYRPESCGGCHSTHYSDHEGLLPAPEETLCLGCHGKDVTNKSKALQNIARQLEDKPFRHGPVADGSCAACHGPHGSDSFRLLNAPYPADFYVPYAEGVYDFCFQCHDAKLLVADSASTTAFRNGATNLHALHAADPRKARTCRTCHEPHAGDNQQLVRTDGAPFGEWKIPIRFQVTDTGGSCAPGCHRPLAYDRQEPADNR